MSFAESLDASDEPEDLFFLEELIAEEDDFDFDLLVVGNEKRDEGQSGQKGERPDDEGDDVEGLVLLVASEGGFEYRVQLIDEVLLRKQ